MNSYIKYFIHFMWVCLGLILFVVINKTIIHKTPLEMNFIIILLMGALLYSVPMSIFAATSANPCTVKITKEIIQDTALDDYIATLDRYLVEKTPERKVYRAKSKYKAWLTNEIIVYKDGDMWFISLPNAYVNKLKKKFDLH